MAMASDARVSLGLTLLKDDVWAWKRRRKVEPSSNENSSTRIHMHSCRSFMIWMSCFTLCYDIDIEYRSWSFNLTLSPHPTCMISWWMSELCCQFSPLPYLSVFLLVALVYGANPKPTYHIVSYLPRLRYVYDVYYHPPHYEAETTK